MKNEERAIGNFDLKAGLSRVYNSQFSIFNFQFSIPFRVVKGI